MKFNIVVVLDMKMCMKENNPGLNINGDNYLFVRDVVSFVI